MDLLKRIPRGDEVLLGFIGILKNDSMSCHHTWACNKVFKEGIENANHGLSGVICPHLFGVAFETIRSLLFIPCKQTKECDITFPRTTELDMAENRGVQRERVDPDGDTPFSHFHSYIPTVCSNPKCL